MSLSERYRGTPYGLALEPDIFGAPAQASAGVSRGRIVVIAGLVLSVGVYGVALAVMGSFGPSVPAIEQGPRQPARAFVVPGACRAGWAAEAGLSGRPA